MSKIGKFILPYGGSGGSSDPNPEVYCPANGYIVDPDAATTPTIDLGGDTNEKIVLLVSSQLDSAISFTSYMTSGQFTTDIYDLSSSLISSSNTNSGTTLNINLDPLTGTLHPDGYYLFKIIITPTTPGEHLTRFLIKTRTYYASGGWPLLEMHFYTPFIQVLTSMTANLCKMLRYVKFYTACDSLTSIASMLGYSTLLKEVYLPSSMNALEIASAVCARCPALRVIVWPTSLPECTSMNSLYNYGGLKKMTPTENALPISMPKCETITSMFEYNDVIQEVEISNDLPKLRTCQNFVLWASMIKRLKFTGNVGDPVLGCNFDWIAGYNYDYLTEVQFPPIVPLMIESSQSTQFKQCYNLKKIILPIETNYISTTWIGSLFGRCENCTSLVEITEITTGSCDYSQGIFFVLTKSLLSWWQPIMKVCYVYTGASSLAVYALSSFQCDWGAIEVDNVYSHSISFGFRYCSFDVTEINRIFTALPTLTGLGTIDFRNNPGYAACNKAIAIGKGWTVS